MRKSSPASKRRQLSLQEAIEVAKTAPSMFTPEQWALMGTIHESAYVGLPPATSEHTQPSAQSRQS